VEGKAKLKKTRGKGGGALRTALGCCPGLAQLGFLFFFLFCKLFHFSVFCFVLKLLYFGSKLVQTPL
jgi:hypothetical protein